MADLLLFVALVIHYYYFTRRARAIRKAWRRVGLRFAARLEEPPPATPGFEPRGLDQPDPSDFKRPALAAFRQRVGQWTGMPPHALRGLCVTLEIGPFRRRVRLLSLSDDIEARQGLDVFCYERRAIRRFPAARLLRMIDPGGGAHEGRHFIDAALALRAKPGPSLLELEGVTQGAAFLIALALQKDEIDDEARRLITEFAHQTARAASFRHSDPLVQTLDAHVARLRPDPRLVTEAIGWTIRQQDDYQRRLLAFARQLDPSGQFADGFDAVEAALNRPKPW
jgi:hypothetical protein